MSGSQKRGDEQWEGSRKAAGVLRQRGPVAWALEVAWAAGTPGYACAPRPPL